MAYTKINNLVNPIIPKEMFFVLLPTLECNLRCDYCFEKHPQGRWTIESTKQIITNILSFLQTSNIHSCKFHWQGGEPLLLEVDYWEQILTFTKKQANEINIRLSQSMQTNLIRYRSEHALIVHKFFDGILGTSFELAPARRMNNGNASIFVVRWREAYKKAQEDHLSIGVLSLLNKRALDMGAAVYLDKLHDEYGINKLRFTLPFQQTNGNGYWLDADEVGNFLADAYTTWNSRGRNSWMEIRPFSYLHARLLGNFTKESGLCMYVNNCADIALSILTNGEVSLCDNFAHPDCEVRYGNIFHQSLNEIYSSISRAKTRKRVAALVDEQCYSCRYLGCCFGGCLVRARKTLNNRFHDHYCESHKTLFSSIENTIADNSSSALNLFQ